MISYIYNATAIDGNPLGLPIEVIVAIGIVALIDTLFSLVKKNEG